jgi:hypothetical protein
MLGRLANLSPQANASFGRAFLISLAIALAIGYGSVSANGRATMISSQEVGPYRIDLSILPARAVVGKTHLSVLIRSLESNDVLTAAEVTVSAEGPEGAATLGPLPLLNQFSPSFFETDLPFDAEGDWQVQVSVRSELGDATALLQLQVYEGGSRVNWILMSALAVLIVAAGVFIWGRVPGRTEGPHSDGGAVNR